MLKRKAYERLLNWKKNRNGQTALLIEGARRVGKSTLAEEFGKSEYRSVITIDFSLVSKEFKELFSDLRTDLDEFFRYLSAIYQTPLYPRDSLIIFDEIQSFPTAREFIKRLVSDGRFDYIETGSLLSIKQNIEDILIPSEEESFRLNPLDFEEFLWALNEKNLSDLLNEHFLSMRPLPEVLHKRAMRRFREYMLIGGMPHVVNEYLSTHSFEAADFEKRQILDLYRKDIGRFAKGYQDKVISIIDEIPSQLSTHEKRFKVSSLATNARMRNYEEAFFWLSDAQITNACFASTDPSIGLNLSRTKSSLKCYMADTGLLTTLALSTGMVTSEDIYRNVLLGKIAINEGMLTENIVAQSLVAKGEKLFFYSQTDTKNNKKRMEIDFLLVRPFQDAGNKPRVCPVEVKSTDRYTLASLDRFSETFGAKVGYEIVLHPKQIKQEGKRFYLPLYMAHLI